MIAISKANEKKLVAIVAATALAISFTSLISAKEPRTNTGAPVIVKSSKRSTSSVTESTGNATKSNNEAPIIKVLPGKIDPRKSEDTLEKSTKRPAAPVIRVAPRDLTQSSNSTTAAVAQRNEAPVIRQAAPKPVEAPVEKKRIEAPVQKPEPVKNETTLVKSPKTASTIQRSKPIAPAPFVLADPAPVMRPSPVVNAAKASFDWNSTTASRYQAEGRLNLGVRQASSIRAESRVRRCEVENSAVCEALHFESTEISVVGKAPGETRIAVWLDEQPEPLVWSVKVDAQKKPSAVGSDNRALTELLADMYPQSRVRLVSAEGELVVEGKAKNRKEAIQILSFIRSVRLIPVVDRLTLQGR